MKEIQPILAIRQFFTQYIFHLKCIEFLTKNENIESYSQNTKILSLKRYTICETIDMIEIQKCLARNGGVMRQVLIYVHFVCQLFPLLCHLHLITYYSCSKLDSKSQFHGKQTLRKCSHFERKSIEIHKLIIVLSSRAFNQIVSFTFSIAFTSFYFRSLNTFYKRIRSLCGSFNQA